jgi:hypothetical protein
VLIDVIGCMTEPSTEILHPQARVYTDKSLRARKREGDAGMAIADHRIGDSCWLTARQVRSLADEINQNFS